MNSKYIINEKEANKLLDRFKTAQQTKDILSMKIIYTRLLEAGYKFEVTKDNK